MNRTLLAPLLLLGAAGALSALDHRFIYAPLEVGQGAAQAERFFGIEAQLKSKALEDTWVYANDATLGVNAEGRVYGLGLGLLTDWGFGQSDDRSRPGERTNPGELLRLEGRVDWAIEIRHPEDSSIPLLQIIPKFRYITYPNQRDIFTPFYNNWLKERQRWVGLDLWYAAPIEGLEVGFGVEQNISSEWRATRAGLGLREFIQYNAVDLAFWQKVGAADAEYRDVVGGERKSGFTTADVGGRVTMPLFLEELFVFGELLITYWLDSDIRDHRAAAGEDRGDVVLAVGISWMPD
ncbi:MAG: hypothetical protein RMM29_04415 [Planctomycetota bacterium]|nr:hypothetical protein [Planctomycetota bacterium]MDW8372879.1 hypothetical protein [Planctomycetota bacterium]